MYDFKRVNLDWIKKSKNFTRLQYVNGCICLPLASSSGQDGPLQRCCCSASARTNKGEKKTPQVCFCPRRTAVDASSHHMSDHSCQSTGQSDPGEAGPGGERSNSGPRG